MDLINNDSIKRFVFQDHFIYVIFKDETNKPIPLTIENMKWVSEFSKSTGTSVNANYNRISPKDRILWREIHGLPPVEGWDENTVLV
ncbi:hypothetical protein [Herbaspirillum sp.]|uniref:hypothetical protein n=1 Tax=Herbaspirillum sp. TaxID=1890675 RepID=UPI001B28B7C1|nr:hypothetical protein [Herbaspirillum sp.]MBO9538297.1 hypothetical protein [Herbaspirillum sp.]